MAQRGQKRAADDDGEAAFLADLDGPFEPDEPTALVDAKKQKGRPRERLRPSSAPPPPQGAWTPRPAAWLMVLARDPLRNGGAPTFWAFDEGPKSRHAIDALPLRGADEPGIAHVYLRPIELRIEAGQKASKIHGDLIRRRNAELCNDPSDFEVRMDEACAHAKWHVIHGSHTSHNERRGPGNNRYLTYNETEGLNNQRIALENARLMAILLNRTLVVPDTIPPHDAGDPFPTKTCRVFTCDSLRVPWVSQRYRGPPKRWPTRIRDDAARCGDVATCEDFLLDPPKTWSSRSPLTRPCTT
ncbi:hypothetical protein JL720_12225 [Aureococcus anophagefferens]|nr:hypothetical protein JL720_12225 [Aureococcus anophagefferens]